jgi:transcriptional regulator with XRE-family HTH domain
MGIGLRVRAARKLAGITQRQLADRAQVRLSLVKQVEQVRVPASPAFVAAVARALEIPATELMSQPGPILDREDHRVHATAEWRGALAFLDGARDRIVDHVRGGDEAAVAMHGVLHLKSGLAAARAGDAATSDAHLTEARHATRHVTAGSDHYRLAFDTDSVNIWSVGLAVERRDGTAAVERAEAITRFAPTTPRERIGHHWIDLARGYQLHGDRDRSLAALQAARRTSPQQTRYHPQVRETVITLAESDKRRTETLAGFARWAGIHI